MFASAKILIFVKDRLRSVLSHTRFRLSLKSWVAAVENSETYRKSVFTGHPWVGHAERRIG